MIHFLWTLKNFFLSLFSRKTVGARALVVQDNKILLVKHTYTPGWYTIGGGIDKGESPLQAVRRELQEEVGITPSQTPTFFGFYHNKCYKRDDYVALYLCTDFTRKEVKSREILEAKWFSLEALPPDMSPGTKRRLDEYLGHHPIRDVW
ncbi:MAG: NUDIX domain-containing protein [Proteobacteria bacterium]|nr:NUDIX domain-containing protein [Pseudomonadota bacterium]